MADKEIPTFLYDMSREQAGGQLSVHNKPCPAINHHSGEKPDLTSHEKNAEKKESASTPMAQPEVRESFWPDAIHLKNCPSTFASLGMNWALLFVNQINQEEVHPPGK